MAYTTIAKPSDHFEADLYAGSASTTTITGIGFKPDLIWTKNRTHDGSNWNFVDSTRGNTKNFRSDDNTAESTATKVASFTSDGLTLTGGVLETNTASDYYIQNLWKANGGTTSSNSSGSITSTVQANTTSGFSIVTYTGTGSNATIGHGLGVAPKMIWVKRRDSTGNTQVYWKDDYQGIDETDFMELADNGAQGDDATKWNDTAATSTVFSIGTDATVNASSGTYVAYCFAQIQGFSHFGHHYGTANEPTAPFCYCGFRPKFVMVKSSSEAMNWAVHTSKQGTIKKDGSAGRTGNVIEGYVFADTSGYEETNKDIAMFSTGFRFPEAHTVHNANDYKYVWVAFADHPIVGTNGTVALAL